MGWEYLENLINQVETVLTKKEAIYNAWRKKVDTTKGTVLGSHFGRPPRKIICNKKNIIMFKGAIAVFFETAGRASEILGLKEKIYRTKPNGKRVLDKINDITPPLKYSNFRFDLHPNFIQVDDMEVLKRYDKDDDRIVYHASPKVSPSQSKLWKYDDEKGLWRKRFWDTTRLRETRTFLFRRDEPLVKYLMDLLKLRKDEDSLLPHDYYFWYWFFRQLDPMKEKYGERVKWKWIYPHWFRAQRASSLAADYGMSMDDIAQWGGWIKLETVRKYVGLGGVIREKMSKATPSWKRNIITKKNFA